MSSSEARVNLFWKMVTILTLEKTLLTIILSAPTLDSLPTNKTNTEIRDTVPRILTRPNGTHQDILLGEEDTPLLHSDIIFPDRYELLTKSKPIVHLNSIPTCAANGLTYCENIESYPYKHVKEMLLSQITNGVPNEFFGVEEAPPELANRIDATEETFICNSYRTTIFPTVGETKNAKWKYIVNQGKDERYVQGVLVELCVKPDLECNLIGNPPVGYTATCKQKYTYRRLLSITDSGQQEPDTFRMPSACCCSFRKDVSFLTERERNVTPSNNRKR